MFDWIKDIIDQGGYWGIVLLMFLENVFPPIPSELIMPLAGFLSVQGEFSFWGVILAGTAGSVLGQFPFYFLGRAFGQERLKKWVKKHGHWAATTPEELERAIQWFGRYRGAAVFFCRLVPTLRSLISIPAGLSKMNPGHFLAYTVAGTALWTAALAGLGKLLESNYKQVSTYLNPVSAGILVLLVMAYFWGVIKSYRKNRS